MSSVATKLEMNKAQVCHFGIVTFWTGCEKLFVSITEAYKSVSQTVQ